MKPDSCRICGNSDAEFLLKIESKRYAPGEYFDLYRCGRCSVIYIEPLIELSDTRKYYPDSYKPHDPEQTKPGNARESIAKHLRKYIYGSRFNPHNTEINTIRRLLSGMLDKVTYRSLPWPQVAGKLLDIGCGSGAYLSVINELGWSGQGVEFNSKAAQHANKTLGLQVQTGDFATTEFPQKHFDVITMWHSLEHFTDPKMIIEKARALLKDDGLLMIGLPNFSSWDRKLFKESWNGLEIPLHVYHFSPNCIKQLLKTSGFKIVKIIHTIRPVDMMKSLINFLEDRYRFKPNKYLMMPLFAILVPMSFGFSILRRSSIIKVFAS